MGLGKGTSNRFLTHLSNCVVVSAVAVSTDAVAVIVVVSAAVVTTVAGAVDSTKVYVHVSLFFEQPPEMFEQPSCFLAQLFKFPQMPF